MVQATSRAVQCSPKIEPVLEWRVPAMSRRFWTPTLDDFYRAAAQVLGVDGATSGGGLDAPLDLPITNRYTTYR